MNLRSDQNVAIDQLEKMILARLIVIAKLQMLQTELKVEQAHATSPGVREKKKKEVIEIDTQLRRLYAQIRRLLKALEDIYENRDLGPVISKLKKLASDAKTDAENIQKASNVSKAVTDIINLFVSFAGLVRA